MRAILVVLAGLGVLGLAVAIVTERLLRVRVVEQVRRAIENAAGGPARLDITPGLLLAHGLRRHVPGARLVLRDVPIANGSAHLRRIEVDLVRLELTGPRRRHGVTAQEGTFSAELSGADLNALVNLPPGISRIELSPDRVRLRTVAGLAVDTKVELTERGLRVRPSGGLLDLLPLLPSSGFTIALPVLPYGAIVRRIEPTKDAVRVHGDLDPAQLTVTRP